MQTAVDATKQPSLKLNLQSEGKYCHIQRSWNSKTVLDQIGRKLRDDKIHNSRNARLLLRRQAVLAQFGEYALHSYSLDEILAEACRLVEEALGTHLAKVMEMRADGETLVVRAGVGWKPGIVGVVTLKVSELTSESHILKTAEPTTSPDLSLETRFQIPPFLIDHGVQSMANVLIPSRNRGQPFGILEVDSREPRVFSEHDLNFLRSYANLLAAAVDRLRAVEELHEREIRLGEGEARLDRAITAAEMGTWEWNAGSDIIRFFPSFEALHLQNPGRSADLTQIEQTVDPEDLPAFSAALHRALQGENQGRLAIQTRAVLPNGLVKWLCVTGSAECNAQGMATRVVGFTQDITANRNAERHVLHMARHDSLTGLLNRQRLRERLEDALARSRRGERCAVLALDLDRFKEVNDSFGHAVGDAVLRSVASRLLDVVHDTDEVARPGGDEFVIIHFGQRPHDAEALASRIFAILSQHHEIEGRMVSTGVSIGIAFAPDHGTNVEQVLNCADLALYGSKGDDHSLFKIFEPEMQARAQSRRQKIFDLKQALDRGEFELHYQPIVHLAQKEIVSFETLIRWRHPVHGLMSPDNFISLAEETGLIEPLGEWILAKACSDAAAWSPQVNLSVNLSVVQFLKGDLVKSVVTAIGQSGLQAQRLELEITESLFLQETDTTLAMLRELHEHGISIVMDDFGIGYSSLGYISRFPFDKIKIDRSFVSAAGQGTSGAAIIKAVSGLCSSLGITTTAEGIETREQLRQVINLGCTQGQGFLFARPRTSAEIPALLTEWPQSGASIMQ